MQILQILGITILFIIMYMIYNRNIFADFERKEVIAIAAIGGNKVVYRGILRNEGQKSVDIYESASVPNQEDMKKFEKKEIKEEEIKYDTFKQIHRLYKDKILSITIPDEEEK